MKVAETNSQGDRRYSRDLPPLKHTANKEMKVKPARFITLIALLALSTALAGPDVQTFSHHVQGTLTNCGDFLAVDDYTEEVRIYTFFDQQNRPTNMLVHVTSTGSVANGANGKVLPEQGELLIWRDLHGGTIAVTSLSYGTTISGVDMVYRNAGKITFRDGKVTFDGAPSQFASRGNGHIVYDGGNSYFKTGSQATASGGFAPLCDALKQ